jgi:glycosyltransferase involved in cell wall biosynthesis
LRINLISSLDEESVIESVSTPNQVYAWFIHKALLGKGVDVRLIRESSLREETPREADHTIVISATVYTYDEPLEKLRKSTIGKLARYMNADKKRGDECFDYCFTQIGPVVYRPEKYICVGWGVDPTYSYPDQDERAAFLDSKVLNHRGMKKLWGPYLSYGNVLSNLRMKTYNPIPIYNWQDRIPYPDYQAILRKCHFFLCTQHGDGGLNRLEAAACGALLVVPTVLYKERTMSLLNHRIWSTEKEFGRILSGDVDIEANRKRALEHRWENVAKRIIEVLENE